MKSQSISPLNPADQAGLLNVNNERVQFSHVCAWEMKKEVLMRRRDGKLSDHRGTVSVCGVRKRE